MKPNDNVKNLMARMKVARVPEDLRRDIEATLLVQKAAQIDARPVVQKRPGLSEAGVDDVGVALSGAILAMVAAMQKSMPGEMRSASLLRAIQEELDSTVECCRQPDGSLQPAERALEVASGMLFLSDPEGASTACAAVRIVALRKWPRNTAFCLADRAGVSQRTAQYWLDTSGGMSADALAEILRSDIGVDVMRKIAVRAAPKV